jgi:5-formyltetrahydrofolate cyclo-ligase
MADSSQLRKEVLAERDRLTADEIRKKSAAIQNSLVNLEEIITAKNIFAYVSFRSEVATRELINTLLDKGKTVTVPITRIKEKRLDAIKITDPGLDLVPGYCNIPEPREELCLEKKVDPADIDVIILPGSVFDKRGGRFGYGGGYYDRFVSAIPKATRIGLAFDLQMVEKAPLQAHDEILDFVVTETEIIRGRR